MAQRIVIKGGYAAGFADELRLPLLNPEKRRVSVIVPTNPVLRAAFVVLRGIIADDSRVAAWTRRWRCDWEVRIDGTRHGPFSDRSKAIRFEKDLIQNSGKIEAYLESAAAPALRTEP